MRHFLFLFLTTLAFTCVSVSSQGWEGPVFHIVGNDAFGYISYSFNINGTLYEDPDLTLIKGQTYQFSIDYINDGTHPFGFASINTGNDVEALGAIGNEWCKTSITNAFITTDTSKPCIVNYTANNDAFYRCKYHRDMNGKLTVITPTTTPPTPTTTTPPTPTPTPTPTPDPTIDNSTSSSSNITIFHVIGNNGTNSYIFNISGVAVENPSFDLVLGQTYQFSIDYINDPAVQVNRKPHPFGFTTKAGPIVEPLGAIGNANCKTSINHTFITTDVSNPCIVTYTANINTLHQCSIHPRMRGALTVIPTNSTNNNSSTSSPTTSTPTSGTPSTFNGTIFHIIGSKGQASYIFNISGVAVENPSFDLVLGETYQFSIDYLNVPTIGAPHPFGFSRDGGETASVEALGAIGNVNCQTSPPNAFVTTDVSKPCIITYVANVNAFYRCAYHDPMKGALTVIPTNSTTNNPPSSSPTTSTPTTSTPTNGTPSTFNGAIFHIIGSRASASYIFNISGVAIENPSFDLILGKTYQFSIDYNNDPATGVPHPFGFSTNGGPAASIEALGAIGNVNCKVSDNAFITTDISKPCIITYTPKVNTFYRCSFHGPMKGALNVIGTAPSSTAGPTPTENPNCVAGVCVNTASSISTSIYLTIIASFIALAATAF